MDILPTRRPRRRTKAEVLEDIQTVYEPSASACCDNVVRTNRGMRLLEQMRKNRTRRR